MSIVQIQFVPWDKIYNFSSGDLELKRGEHVVVETELGKDLGRIVSLIEEKDYVPEKDENGEVKPLKSVLRKAEKEEIDKVYDEEKKWSALDFCKEMVDKRELPMKLVDVRLSLDGSRITFAFISDGRVDFRELVKDLTSHFGSAVRLTQIGSRDEAKLTGDCGPCGRGLCCRGHLQEFSSITSEMAEAQQVVHRGSERISGMCGRLMCCLSYEYEGYVDMSKALPPIGTKVNVDGRRGVVINHHILKQSVDVEFSNEKGEREIAEIDINRHKKKEKNS
ncbi:MAG: stage 0 sporulation protein [Planctomycetes bacterium]|jgi:cell fate regulator YaaT (PSP1 superfamily)|nr:stage 0 sporulation protein [Planctomycetota bacterium]